MEKEIEYPTCQVCNNEPGTGVAASPLGPFSVSYGMNCLEKDAEPIWAIETLLEMNGGAEGCNDWFLDEVHAYINGSYITVRELIALQKLG